MKTLFALVQVAGIVAGTLLVFALLVARAYIVPAFVMFTALIVLDVNFDVAMFTAASFATALAAVDIYKGADTVEG